MLIYIIQFNLNYFLKEPMSKWPMTRGMEQLGFTISFLARGKHVAHKSKVVLQLFSAAGITTELSQELFSQSKSLHGLAGSKLHNLRKEEKKKADSKSSSVYSSGSLFKQYLSSELISQQCSFSCLQHCLTTS